MTHSFRSGSNMRSLRRHDTYYLNGGDLFLLAESVVFRVHRYFFERDSESWAARLQPGVAPGSEPLGTSESTAILLDGVKSNDLATFLWVFYNPKYSLYDTDVDDWAVILNLSTFWSFREARALAIRELERLWMEDIDRIVLYQDNNVDRALLIPRYIAVTDRAEPLTLEEGTRLGLETALTLAKAREMARSITAEGATRESSPSGLKEDQLRGIIQDLFSVFPSSRAPESPPAARTSTSALYSNVQRGPGLTSIRQASRQALPRGQRAGQIPSPVAHSPHQTQAPMATQSHRRPRLALRLKSPQSHWGPTVPLPSTRLHPLSLVAHPQPTEEPTPAKTPKRTPPWSPMKTLQPRLAQLANGSLDPKRERRREGSSGGEQDLASDGEEVAEAEEFSQWSFDEPTSPADDVPLSSNDNQPLSGTADPSAVEPKLPTGGDIDTTNMAGQLSGNEGAKLNAEGAPVDSYDGGSETALSDCSTSEGTLGSGEVDLGTGEETQEKGYIGGKGENVIQIPPNGSSAEKELPEIDLGDPRDEELSPTPLTTPEDASPDGKSIAAFNPDEANPSPVLKEPGLASESKESGSTTELNDGELVPESREASPSTEPKDGDCSLS